MNAEKLIKRFEHAANILLILSVLSFLTVAYMLVFPLKVSWVKTPAPVLTPVVEAGNNLIYNLTFCIYHPSPAIIYQRLRNDLTYILPTTGSSNPPKGCYSDVVSVHIPSEVPEGTYVFEATAVHRINPLREWSITWQTEPFVVVKRGD